MSRSSGHSLFARDLPFDTPSDLIGPNDVCPTPRVSPALNGSVTVNQQATTLARNASTAVIFPIAGLLGGLFVGGVRAKGRGPDEFAQIECMSQVGNHRLFRGPGAGRAAGFLLPAPEPDLDAEADGPRRRRRSACLVLRADPLRGARRRGILIRPRLTDVSGGGPATLARDRFLRQALRETGRVGCESPS